MKPKVGLAAHVVFAGAARRDRRGPGPAGEPAEAGAVGRFLFVPWARVFEGKREAVHGGFSFDCLRLEGNGWTPFTGECRNGGAKKPFCRVASWETGQESTGPARPEMGLVQSIRLCLSTNKLWCGVKSGREHACRGVFGSHQILAS